MSENHFVLCGGTFFTLILEARKRISRHHKNPPVLRGLLEVAFPGFIVDSTIGDSSYNQVVFLEKSWFFDHSYLSE